MTNRLAPFLDRAEQARLDYVTALAQISEDARDIGIQPAEIIGDLVMSAWVREHAKRAVQGRIYFAKVEDLDVVKVGFSTSVDDRMRALRAEHKRGFEVLGTVPGTMHDERWIHRMLYWCRDRTLKGNEFFKFAPTRGLIRIFLGVGERFPFDDEKKAATDAWVNSVRESKARNQPTPEAALKAIGDYFEEAAAEQQDDPPLPLSGYAQ